MIQEHYIFLLLTPKRDFLNCSLLFNKTLYGFSKEIQKNIMQACCISMCFFTPFSAKMRAHSCKCDAAVYQIFGKCPRHNRHCSNPNITRLLSKLWSSILNGLERSHAIYFCQISTYRMENLKMRYFFRNKKFEVNQMFQQNVINLLYLMYIWKYA